ncbi:hypothetical protein D3Z36_09820 [Lachnospiraceae bacterium]|nr:hypothetical protein [Lachnospiraceae bacterium]
MDVKIKNLEKMTSYSGEEAVIQNMRDAGCSQDIIERCLACIAQGNKKGLLDLLNEHRESILSKVHEEEKQIDCLDYLVFQIGRCLC